MFETAVVYCGHLLLAGSVFAKEKMNGDCMFLSWVGGIRTMHNLWV
jgi:hypothetical protein